jgi:hypothetical protein
LTALRGPQIAVLAADTGPLQMSLFDEQNFAEITHPDYPGERLVACRNPALADLRGRNRLDLLTETEKAAAPCGEFAGLISSHLWFITRSTTVSVGPARQDALAGRRMRLSILAAPRETAASAW